MSSTRLPVVSLTAKRCTLKEENDQVAPLRVTILIPIIMITIQWSLAHYAVADIRDDIAKYSQVVIDETSLARLKKFEGMVTYFTSIPFFKSNELVSREFLNALILAESSANPQAISRDSARGLCQITYETAKIASQALIETQYDFLYIDENDLHQLEPDDLFKPEINILLSTYLLSKYNDEFDGRLDLVITAWNAGENNRSLKNNMPADYRETENLIGKVNGYYIFLLQKSKMQKDVNTYKSLNTF